MTSSSALAESAATVHVPAAGSRRQRTRKRRWGQPRSRAASTCVTVRALDLDRARRARERPSVAVAPVLEAAEGPLHGGGERSPRVREALGVELLVVAAHEVRGVRGGGGGRGIGRRAVGARSGVGGRELGVGIGGRGLGVRAGVGRRGLGVGSGRRGPRHPGRGRRARPWRPDRWASLRCPGAGSGRCDLRLGLARDRRASPRRPGRVSRRVLGPGGGVGRRVLGTAAVGAASPSNGAGAFGSGPCAAAGGRAESGGSRRPRRRRCASATAAAASSAGVVRPRTRRPLGWRMS